MIVVIIVISVIAVILAVTLGLVFGLKKKPSHGSGCSLKINMKNGLPIEYKDSCNSSLNANNPPKKGELYCLPNENDLKKLTTAANNKQTVNLILSGKCSKYTGGSPGVQPKPLPPSNVKTCDPELPLNNYGCPIGQTCIPIDPSTPDKGMCLTSLDPTIKDVKLIGYPANNIYKNGEGKGCSSNKAELKCPATFLGQFNSCCESNICKSDVCTACEQDIDCNLVQYEISKISDIKCQETQDREGKVGKFCNNISSLGSGARNYKKSCRDVSDCIIPCSNGVCKYNDEMASYESCTLGVVYPVRAPGISETDPRVYLCSQKISDSNPCKEAKTRLGCTRASKKYDCYVKDDLISTTYVNCSLG
jgi:hypothetical protein